MKVIVEMYTFETIMNNSWSGAKDVCREIYKQHRSKEAMNIIEDIFSNDIPNDAELNDFICFELADIMHLY